MDQRITAARLVGGDGRTVEIETQSGDTIKLTPDSPFDLWRRLSDFRLSGGEIEGAAPAYTIRAARVANPEGDAVIVATDESGDVAVTERDRPELWAKLQAWRAAGGVVATYAPQASDQPRRVEEEIEGLKRVMIAKGVLTAADIEDATSATTSIASQIL